MDSVEISVLANGYQVRKTQDMSKGYITNLSDIYVFESMENLKAFLDDNLTIPKAKETK